LSNEFQFVDVNNTLSTHKGVNIGVSQGSFLGGGAIVFNLY